MTQTKNTLWGVFTREGNIHYFAGRPLIFRTRSEARKTNRDWHGVVRKVALVPQIRTTGGA